jgi:hypothetical protein
MCVENAADHDELIFLTIYYDIRESFGFFIYRWPL